MTNLNGLLADALYPSLVFILISVTFSHCSMFDFRSLSAVHKGTPKKLRDIFIGRCEEYQEVIYPKPFITNPKNCSYLYQLFSEAFSYKDPCDVPVSNYYKFTSAAEHEIDTKDKVLYYSGNVYPFIDEYTASMRRYVTIRDILSGYVVKNIEAWCGQKSDPGFNSTECPSYGQCRNQATPTYWAAISENFARRVQGHISVLLNGSIDAAYHNTSIFSKYELANLEPKRNPSITVLLIHNIEPSGVFRETCTNGSLLELKNDVEKKQIAYTCIDDPVQLQQNVDQTVTMRAPDQFAVSQHEVSTSLPWTNQKTAFAGSGYLTLLKSKLIWIPH